MMKYITKIRAKISIHAKKKTGNIFDGSYKSIYTGNGFDFENLREYIPGDSIRDIDWKASSRSRSLLVKRYVAEKEHNIMLVFDTGKKMLADTKDLQCKKEIALYVGGTVGYLTAKNGDNVGAVYNKNGMVQYHRADDGLYNIERILTSYDKEDFALYNCELEKSLDFIIKNIKKRMIVFVISDASGIKKIQEDTLKKLTYRHDVLFISISDADLTSGQAYNMDRDVYIPEFISNNKQLMKIEQETKKKILAENERKLIRHQIVSAHIDNEDEIVDKIIELLERHKYANNR